MVLGTLQLWHFGRVRKTVLPEKQKRRDHRPYNLLNIFSVQVLDQVRRVEFRDPADGACHLRPHPLPRHDQRGGGCGVQSLELSTDLREW